MVGSFFGSVIIYHVNKYAINTTDSSFKQKKINRLPGVTKFSRLAFRYGVVCTMHAWVSNKRVFESDGVVERRMYGEDGLFALIFS